ncbi:LAETG motif-containing sortase-dependent surface protein, partial [Streptomyces dysideae]|uniref:LAETG motif-containing sortase-dependent surface protein n=1 Tax=Streptomyces dysideae TaxID=909626 RepID=UPI000B0C71E9
APAGYDLYKPSKNFSAKPGSPVTVTITNTKAVGTTPKPNLSEKPSDEPNQDEPTSDNPTQDEADTEGSASSPSASASDVQGARQAASSTSVPAPRSTLAHTGADATPWLLGSAGLLIAAGGGAVLAARRRRPDGDVSED